MASPTLSSAVFTAGVGPNPVGGLYDATAPSGMADKEVALAFLYTDPFSSNPQPPPGFTLKASAVSLVAAKSFAVWLAWKRATGADAGPYTWSGLTGAGWVEGLCCRASGCVPTGDPINVFTSGALAASGTAGPALSVTTTLPATLFVLFTGVFDAKNQTPATGFAEAVDSNDDVEACYLAQAAAGASGTCQTTWTTATAAASILVALASTYPLEQEGARWRNDDGSETTATWAAAQDANLTASSSNTQRLRFIVNASGDQPLSQFSIRVRKVGDPTFVKVK